MAGGQHEHDTSGCDYQISVIADVVIDTRDKVQGTWFSALVSLFAASSDKNLHTCSGRGSFKQFI